MKRDHQGQEPNSMHELLHDYGNRAALKNALREVSSSRSAADELEPSGEGKLRVLWSRLRINVLAAACVAILTAFSTLWLSGYYKTMEKNSSNYRELRRDMNNVKRNVNEHQRAIRGISGELPKSAAANNFGATGFLLSSDGYVVTNHHVISDADSVHLQDSQGKSYRAKVLHLDPAADLAILKIDDPDYMRPSPTPYTFKTTDSDLGEDVFTLGYPRDEAVYGQGYLSSMSGYKGDTTAYQISIPLNPGNSGGPLLDSKGRVIGIISGKQAGLDGTSFAIKTKALLSSIAQIPVDSLQQAIQLSTRNTLSRLPRTEQVKKIHDCVFIVKVF